jgi:hypothetical protein
MTDQQTGSRRADQHKGDQGRNHYRIPRPAPESPRQFVADRVYEEEKREGILK